MLSLLTCRTFTVALVGLSLLGSGLATASASPLKRLHDRVFADHDHDKDKKKPKMKDHDHDDRRNYSSHQCLDRNHNVSCDLCSRSLVIGRRAPIVEVRPYQERRTEVYVQPRVYTERRYESYVEPAPRSYA